jgi:hypothetical protein
VVRLTSRTIAFPLFTHSSRRRLLIDQAFFEQIRAGSQGVVPKALANSSGAPLAAAQEVERNFGDAPRFVVGKPYLM